MREAPIIVCRCEEVDLEKIVSVLKLHGCTSREVKLRTRAGMGICGGRTCRPLLDRLVHGTETDLNEELPLKVQAPVRPVAFGDWGRSE